MHACDYKRWERPRGCRKRARIAVLVRWLVGRQVTGMDDREVYSTRVLTRCEVHADERIVNAEYGPGAFQQSTSMSPQFEGSAAS